MEVFGGIKLLIAEIAENGRRERGGKLFTAKGAKNAKKTKRAIPQAVPNKSAKNAKKIERALG